jgi:TatD DNase family protein
MYLIDSHCHLDRFSDIDRVLDRSKACGIHQWLSISTSPLTFKALLPIVHHYDGVYGTVGLHPREIDTLSENAIGHWLKEGLQYPKIVGIGETGLDAQESSPPMDQQERYFRHHIRMAIETQLPLVVHTRNSDQDFLSILRDVRAKESGGKNLKGVLHCFTGSLECAKEAIDWGWKVSISGIVTFKNAPAVHQLATQLPLWALLVETDAPWLAPTPYRGKDNEPAYMMETVKAMAALRGCSITDIAKATMRNTLELFHKMPAVHPKDCPLWGEGV